MASNDDVDRKQKEKFVSSIWNLAWKGKVNVVQCSLMSDGQIHNICQIWLNWARYTYDDSHSNSAIYKLLEKERFLTFSVQGWTD